MSRPTIGKARSTIASVKTGKPRPGFTGNLLFLLIALGMVTLIAQSGSVTEHPGDETAVAEEVAVPAFTDDELFFYQDTITRLLLSQNFNGGVLVARNGTVLLSRSFGFADFRNHTPLTQDTPFQLASISKTFTASAVLLLHERGQLHIDSAVSAYIPEFPYPQITVRQLLNHTSGLQNYMWLVERYWKAPHPPGNEDMLQLFVRHTRPLDFRPGTRWAYSNTGYGFLGLLVERVSGQGFSAFLHENIFGPLGMHNSFVYDLHADEPAPPARAYGFRPWGRGHIIIPDVPHDGVSGDKGIYSSITDLYKWDQAISRNEILSEEGWQTAFAYTRLANERRVRYGLGWRLQSFLDHEVVHHPGRWNGFRTSFKRFPTLGATIIILNNTNRNVAPLINELQNIVFRNEIAAMETAPKPEDQDEYDMVGGQ